MSTQTLSSVAIDVVEQYHQAGQHLARAYQAGVQRAAEALCERFAAGVNGGQSPLLSEGYKSSLIAAQQRIAGIVVEQLRAGSERVAPTHDRIAGDTKSGIERWAGDSSRVDANGADTLALINLPAAQASLAVASAIAQGAKRLSDTVAGGQDAIEVAEVATPKRVKRG
jgi:hypothetical protein